MPKFILSVKLDQIKQQFGNKKLFIANKASNQSRLILMIVLIFLVGVSYLWQVNGLATKGYKIKELEEKVSVLREQSKKTELAIAELRSTERINSEVQRLGLVQVARVQYLTANGTTVAINR